LVSVPEKLGANAPIIELCIIGCTKCGIATKLVTPELARKLWNTRVDNTNNNDNWGE
jgi:hypothetical protein